VAQLEDVTEQHQPIDVGEPARQDLEQLRPRQQIGITRAAKVEIRDD
jgi:hypothetical protein